MCETVMHKEKRFAEKRLIGDETDPALDPVYILSTLVKKYYIVDKNHNIVRANIQLDAEFSDSLSSIQGKSLRSAFPISGSEIVKTVDKVFETGHPIFIELEMDTLNRGTVMKRETIANTVNSVQQSDPGYELIAYYPLCSLDGKVKYVMATMIDITRRKKAGIAQLAEKHMLTRIVESMPNEYFLVNIEGRFHRWNRHFEESLGYTTSEVSRLRLSDVFIDQQIQKLWKSFEIDQKQTIKPIRCRLRHKGGTELQRFIIGSVRPIRNVPHMICMGVNMDTISYCGGNDLGTWSNINDMISQLEMENIYLREEIELEFQHTEIIGKSLTIKNVLQQVESVSKTGSSVLILGETGTGKELISRAIHGLSSRKERPMIKVNCAAFPPDLIEDELFGHEKGAFTGAISSRPGRFEVADGSTLFLDEIGEIPLSLQPKLLRVLQEGEFERLGGTETIKIDVRIIAATNQNLEELIKKGEFRQDLYYRLNIFPIAVPPLRERKEDIPLLMEKFVKEFAEKNGKRIELVPKKTIKSLQRYSWPGNIRELRNVIERAIILAKGPILHINLPKIDGSDSESMMTLDEVQKQHIISVLEQTNRKIRGNDGAAKILGMKPTTLESRMKKLGIA